LLDDMYGLGKPEDLKVSNKLVDQNGLGGPDDPDRLRRSNNPDRLSRPDDSDEPCQTTHTDWADSTTLTNGLRGSMTRPCKVEST